MTSNFKVIDVPSDCGMFFDDDSTGYFPQKDAHKRFKKNLVVILVEEEKIQNFRLSETVRKLKQKQKLVLN